MSVLASTPAWVDDSAKVAAAFVAASGALVLLFRYIRNGIQAAVGPDLARLDKKIDSMHDEVRSPNGSRTGDIAYETGKRVIELREQMVEIRETQLQIARMVNDLDDRDDERFGAIESRLDGLSERLDAVEPRPE